MKKKLILMMALLCCLVLVVGILAACNGDEGTQPGGQTPGNSSAYAGRYYEQVNGNLNADSWIELDDDWSWTDSDTMMGTFTVKGSNIYFYWMTTSEPMFGGTISNGELTIDLYGTYYTYKQGTPSVDKPGDPDKEDPDDEKPEEPEEPEEEYFTVTFNVNGGDSAISSREYLAGALMSLPTPTRDGYRFLGWYDAMGRRYDNTSVMPDNDLTLTARWEIVVSSYEDEYVYFKPATAGKKQPNNFYYPFQDAGIHHYIYVELESDNIGGPNAVGDKNNLDLASRVDMEFSVEDGYTLTWYNDSSFTSINGAQMFTLDYGSNVYFLTVSEGTRVVQRYLIDFYIKHDYYINLYHDIYATRPYDKVRVVEGELLPDDIRQSVTSGLEFDKWVYRNVEASEYVEFDFSTLIREDWSLYQTFKPKKITADLDGGTLNEDIYVTPYEAGHKLPVPTKEGYDFIGWQLPGYDDVMRAYFADRYGNNVSKMLGSGGGAMDDVYFDTLKAVWLPKQFTIQESGDTVSLKATQADITYTDDDRINIESIQYRLSGSSAYIPSDELYGYGEEVTLTAAKPGYTFLGWYNGEDKLTDSLTYEFIMPAENVTLTKTWSKVTVESEDTTKGTVSQLTETYFPGDTASVTATTKSGCTFIGWYNGDEKLTNSLTYEFTMPAENVTYTAKWIKVTVESEDTSKGTVSQLTGKYFPGDKISVTATTNSGYTFIGWYNGDEKLTDTLTYEFTMPAENVTYTAKWVFYTVSLEKTEGGSVGLNTIDSSADISFDLNGAGGIAPVTQTVTSEVGLVYPEIPAYRGHVFAGWYDNSGCEGSPFDFSVPVTRDVTLYAKWISYSGSGVIPYNGSLTVDVVSKSSSTKHYYAFVPLVSGNISVYSNGGMSDTYGTLYDSNKRQLTYDDDSGDGNNFKITYSVTAGKLYYIVPAGYNSSGTTTVYLSGDMPDAGGTYDDGEPIKITVGERVKLTATTNSGYTFIGWYNGEEKVTDALTYEFTMSAENVTYTAKWIKVAIVSEDTSKGTVSQLAGTYFPGDDVSVTATTNPGYTFIGWYNGDEKLTDTLTYEFTMPAENVTYTAKWIICPVNLDVSSSAAGSVSMADTTVVGERVTITATTNAGYTFIGWYNGDDKLTDSVTYEFTMSAESVTYTAKWEMNPEMEPFVFTSTPTSLTITEVKTKDATSLTIPAYVTDIDTDAFSGCNALASIEVDAGSATFASVNGILYNKAKTEFVHIPDALAGNVSVPYGITSIGNAAFSGRSGLTSITIPDSVTSIREDAFEGCSGLTSVTIPNSVTSIGDAFSGCNNITSATMPTIAIDYIPQDSLQTVVLTSGESIGDRAFYGCTGLTSIAIPNSVTSIGDYAFYDCTGLTSVTIPNSVTSIGQAAFYGCSSFESITLPFVGATKDGTSNTHFGYIFGASEYYYNDGYVPASLKEVIITGGTSIGGCAFYGCTGLTSVTIGSGVTSIGGSAFSGCSGLTSITIPDGVTSIGDYAFEDCAGLTSVTIGNGVTSIGYLAFCDCSGLTSVTIPDSVTSIGQAAFFNCSGLTSVTFEVTTGWYRTSSSTATSGTSLSSSSLANSATAAEWLTSTYDSYYWKRNV